MVVTYSSIVIGIREMHRCLSQSYYEGIVQSSLFSFHLIVHFAYVGYRFQQLCTVLEKKEKKSTTNLKYDLEAMNELNASVEGHGVLTLFRAFKRKINKRLQLKAQQTSIILKQRSPDVSLSTI